jgi:ligand-binding SRPBCC domain-containing protein
MRFIYECRIPGDLDEVFAFHQDPANLAVLQRGMPGFRMLEHRMEPVCIAWFSLRVLGCLPIVLGFRRTLFDPPHRFAEELIHGPFSYFRHEHQFAADGAGVVVRDLLDYDLPWRFGGALGVRAVVRPNMDWVFAFRHRALRRLAATRFAEATPCR